MDDFESWKQEATPHSKTIQVCFDRELVGEWEAAQEQLRDVTKGMLEAPAELENHVEQLSKKVREKTRELTFTSIGRRAWRELLAQHPPTKSQQITLGKGIDHNPETFPPAAIAVSSTKPKLTLEQAQWMCDELPLGVFDRIWAAVLTANMIGGDEKKAAATVAPPATDKK